MQVNVPASRTGVVWHDAEVRQCPLDELARFVISVARISVWALT